jgi:Porin PorA
MESGVGMRRIVGLVMIALGTALVGMAVALPSYVYPRLTKLPNDPNATIIAKGDGVTVLKVRRQKTEPVTDTVYVTRYVTKDSNTQNRPKPPDGVAQWRLGFTATLKTPTGDLLNAYLEGYTFDKVSAEPKSCCSDYVKVNPDDAGVPIRHEGLGLKFPFDTQKQTYQFWDLQLRRAQAMNYVGTEELFGLQTYKFVQEIKDQTVGSQAWPGSLFNDPAPSVTADEVYSTVRTLWVEPITGAIIKGSEKLDWRYVYQGTTVPRTIGTLTYTDATVKAQVDLYTSPASQLKFFRSTAPLVCWILGPLLVLAGIALLLLTVAPAEPDLEDEYAEDGQRSDVGA